MSELTPKRVKRATMTNQQLQTLLEEKETYVRTLFPKSFSDEWLKENLFPLKEQLSKEGVSGSLEERIKGLETPEPLDEGIEPFSYKLNEAARQLGHLGGLAKSAAKTAAARENGKLGGRPKKKKRPARLPNDGGEL